jgi:hypothetical protein
LEVDGYTKYGIPASDGAVMKTNSSSDKSSMIKNMKIVVIGGNGLIGTKLVNNLRQNGHEIVAASPASGVNTITGEGENRVASKRIDKHFCRLL